MKENQERIGTPDVPDGVGEQEPLCSSLPTFSATPSEASEERVQLLSCAVMQTRDSVFITDKEHRVVFVNEAFSNSFGYGEGEMLGRRADLLFGDDLMELPEGSERSAQMEGMHVRKDGSEFLAATSRSVIGRNDGRPWAYVYVTRDMTARQQAEVALQRRVRQQAAVAVLGQRALRGQEVHSLMDCASLLMADVLAVELCGVLELVPGGAEFVLRSGTGWPPGKVGILRIPAEPVSFPGHTLHSREVVIVEDLRTETRFACPEYLSGHRVVSGLSVMIRGKGRSTACWRCMPVAAVPFPRMTPTFCRRWPMFWPQPWRAPTRRGSSNGSSRNCRAP